MVIVQAAAQVEHGRRADNPRPGHGRAVGRVGARAGEPAVGRPAVLTVQTGIEHDRTHETQAKGHLIFRAQRVVQFRVEGIGRLVACLRLLEIVLAERSVDVRQRDEREQPLRDRADAAGRNQIVREDRAIGAADVACRRIVDMLRHGAEVAVPHGRGRHDGLDDVAQIVDRPLVVAEEEEFVLHDRAADRRPAVRERRRRFQVREGIARAGLLVVPEEERAALEGVRAGFQRHVRDRAARAAELRIVVARRHADRLERVRRGDDHLQQAGLLIVVEPLDHRVVRQARLAVDLGRQRVLRVEERGMLAVRTGRAGHGHQETLEVPIEGEGEVRHHFRFDEPSGIRAVCLDHRTLAGHGDRLFDRADLHFEIHADRRVHRHDHALADVLLEADHLRHDGVGAVFQTGECVEAALVARRAVADVGAGLGNRHVHARHGQPG